MFNDYIQSVEEKQQAELNAHYKELLAAAIEKKAYVLDYIKMNFAMFWERHEMELRNAPAGFLQNGRFNSEGCGYGAPGIVLGGLIFAVYRGSSFDRLAVAKYNGTELCELIGAAVGPCERDDKLAEILRKWDEQKNYSTAGAASSSSIS